MPITKVALHHIERALREKIALECPGYNADTVEKVVSASMKRLNVSRDVLYRAIELAAKKEDNDSL